jgi:hypothetical protein
VKFVLLSQFVPAWYGSYPTVLQKVIFIMSVVMYSVPKKCLHISPVNDAYKMEIVSQHFEVM